jgi:gelsolin
MVLLPTLLFWRQASPDVNKPQVEASKPKPEANGKDSTPSKDSPTVTPTIQEDLKEGQPENEEGLPVYPYERLRTSSINPVTDIDVTKREVNTGYPCDLIVLSLLPP